MSISASKCEIKKNGSGKRLEIKAIKNKCGGGRSRDQGKIDNIKTEEGPKWGRIKVTKPPV